MHLSVQSQRSATTAMLVDQRKGTNTWGVTCLPNCDSEHIRAFEGFLLQFHLARYTKMV